jgi:hypothetical protein
MLTNTPHRPTQVILHIARSFPTLACVLRNYHPVRFHPQDLYDMSKGWSTSEIHLRNFVITVWSPVWAEKEGCSFNLFRALGCFDHTNREVLMKWLNDPCFSASSFCSKVRQVTLGLLGCAIWTDEPQTVRHSFSVKWFCALRPPHQTRQHSRHSVHLY